VAGPKLLTAGKAIALIGQDIPGYPGSDERKNPQPHRRNVPGRSLIPIPTTVEQENPVLAAENRYTTRQERRDT